MQNIIIMWATREEKYSLFIVLPVIQNLHTVSSLATCFKYLINRYETYSLHQIIRVEISDSLKENR